MAEDKRTVSFKQKILSNIGGLIAVTIMVVNWVAYAEIMQTFKGGGFNHLYFIRYLSPSGYTLRIISWYFIFTECIINTIYMCYF